jgi:uncharacterized protein (DUF58 family)
MAKRRLNLPWRQPETETGPLRLTARRLYILPTRIGLVFGLLLFGLLLASVNYGISLGYLFTFLLAGVGVAGLFHTQRNLLGITLRPLAVAPVFAGETAHFRLLLENPGPRLRGAFVLIHPGATSHQIDLPASGTGELVLDLEQTRRGFHRTGKLTLGSTWPLGLFRCWTVFALDWGALVYPRPATTSLPFPPASGQGQAASRRQPGDDEFFGLRDYRPGDSPRRIAWKSVARGQPPLTKQFVGAGGGEAWLDWNDCPEADAEARLERLVRWALDAEQAGLTWGLNLPGTHLPPGRGEHHLKQALEALARHGD